MIHRTVLLDRPTLFGALAAGALLVLPFAAVSVPPMTDLPQQLAQITLLQQALDAQNGLTEDAAYRIQWWHPNKLGYALLGIARVAAGAFGTPLAAGRIAGALLALSWLVAFLVVARRRQRPLEAAVLAALFVFSHSTYWGLVNFQLGLPVFVAWFLLLADDDPARPTARRTLRLGTGALALYAAHVLWLAAGLAWLGVDTIARAFRRTPSLRRLVTARALGAAPALALTTAWYPTLASGGFTSKVYDGYALADRLAPEMLVACTFGGLRGRLETTVAAALAAWALVSLGSLAARAAGAARAVRASRGEQPAEPGRFEKRPSDPGLDGPLLGAATLLGAAYLVLPAVAQNTIFLASRWLAPAGALTLCALPRLPVRPALARTGAAVLVVSFTLATTNAWVDFEREELDGLVPALEAVGTLVDSDRSDDPDAPPRLLGLDLVRQSAIVRDTPFTHLAAYARVLHRVRLASSFAEQASSLVVYRELPFTPPWTPDLHKRSDRLRRSDLDYFDAVLVQAPPAMHEQLFGRDPRLEPLTPPARWRLYRVDRRNRTPTDSDPVDAGRSRAESSSVESSGTESSGTGA